MPTLIAVIGNCGSGKTALTRKLSDHYGLAPLLEQHHESPFQASFQSDLRQFALANQIDYFLFRAEQELSLPETDKFGIADGGLDQDYYIFTHLFHRKGFLDDREYALCERLYHTLRRTPPAPDLLIHLTTPLNVLDQRRAARSRDQDIVMDDDLPVIDELMAAWMQDNTCPVITSGTSQDDADYSITTGPLLTALDRFFPLP